MKKLFCIFLVNLLLLIGCESKPVSNVEKEEVLVENVANVDELNNRYYYNF